MSKLAGHGVRAVSVAGLETCIELPEWKLCFDIGRCPPTASRLPRILFTHGHSDHMGGLVHHCAQRALLGMKPPVYCVPEESASHVEALLDTWRRLDHAELPCVVVPVAPGDLVDLGKGRRARVFRAVHRVPAVGYALVRSARRLRPDLQGSPRERILALRQQGAPIHEEQEIVEVAFCGDTTIDVVDREPLVRRARLLVLEVTFLDERVSPEAARAKGHVHLDDVIARAERFENEVILATHISLRYGRDEIRRILDRRLPPALRDRLVPLLPEPPWVRRATDG